jgi:anti-sigma B factor antagonist
VTDADLPFAIRSATVGDAIVISVSGELDMATSPELARTIELVTAQVCKIVVVDLTGVTFLDSSGLDALVRGQRDLVERGVWLRLATAPGSAVRRVLEITHLTDALVIVDSVDDALV